MNHILKYSNPHLLPKSMCACIKIIIVDEMVVKLYTP